MRSQQKKATNMNFHLKPNPEKVMPIFWKM